jgi:AraC-like DNA-binding protein
MNPGRMRPVKTKCVTGDEFVEALTTATPKNLQVTLSSYRSYTGYWTCGHRVISDHILWFLDRGEVQGKIREKAFRIKPRTFHWISSSVPHDLESVGPHRFSLFTLRFQLKQNGALLRLKNDRVAIESLPKFRRTMDLIYLTLKFKPRFWFLKFRSLLMVLVMDMLEELEDPDAHFSHGFSMNQLKIMTQYLQQNPGRKITSLDLAGLFHLSLDYFSRKFRCQFGLSPRSWLRNEQARNACALLSDTSMSIKEISHLLGYEDQRFFSRQFKKVVEMTPSEYRQKH